MNKSRFQDAYAFLGGAMGSICARRIQKHAHSCQRRGEEALISRWFVLADDSLIRLPRVRNQMHIHDFDFPGQRIVNPGVGPFSSVETITVTERTGSERDSPTCVELTACFGLDAKFFTRTASVYRDGCEQGLQ